MIGSVTEWFEITQYSDKKEIMIANLLETMFLVRYPYILGIMYDQGGEFLSREFLNSVIEKKYLLRFTLNTTPPPDRVSSPNRDAAVAIAASDK